MVSQVKPGKPAPLAISVVPFDEAIESARARRVTLPETYYGVLQGIERAEAFSVAGIASLDQLQQTLDSLAAAMQKGMTFDDWKAFALKAPDVLALPPHRLDNIFRTNIQGAYARGRCVHIERNRHTRPFLMYSAIDDDRTRPAHHAMNGHVAKVGDDVWKKWTPPCGYRCRCTVISLTEAQAQQRIDADKARLDADAEAAMARAAAIAGGPDTGWDYSPCEHMDEGTTRAAADKRRRYADALKPKLDETMKRARAIRGAEDAGYWKKIESAKGSNPGGLFEAPDGTRHYVKFYADPDQARSELAAHRIHRMMGLETPETRIVTIDGKTAFASKWEPTYRRLTLQELHDPIYRDDIAAIFQASVITRNWDVVGQNFDNIVLNPATGRLLVVDTGASFKFRAQGGIKPDGFPGTIAEVKTLRDRTLNPQAQAVFSKHFSDDVFSEREAAARVMPGITKSKIDRAFEEAGFKAADVALLSDSVMARKAALVERYDLDGKRTPPEAWRMIGTFRNKWGSVALADAEARLNPEQSIRIHDALKDVMPSFGRWMNRYIDPRAEEIAQSIFNDGWSGSSSSMAGATVKVWAAERHKGVDVGYHSNKTGGAATTAAKAAETRFRASLNVSAEAVKAVLETEWAFQQYLLRRVHGWDDVTIYRGMESAEFRNAFKPAAAGATDPGKPGVYKGNAVLLGYLAHRSMEQHRPPTQDHGARRGYCQDVVPGAPLHALRIRRSRVCDHRPTIAGRGRQVAGQASRIRSNNPG